MTDSNIAKFPAKIRWRSMLCNEAAEEPTVYDAALDLYAAASQISGLDIDAFMSTEITNAFARKSTASRIEHLTARTRATYGDVNAQPDTTELIAELRAELKLARAELRTLRKGAQTTVAQIAALEPGLASVHTQNTALLSALRPLPPEPPSTIGQRIDSAIAVTGRKLCKSNPGHC